MKSVNAALCFTIIFVIISGGGGEMGSDPCSPNPCKNGGTCSVNNSANNAVCSCPTEYEGITCALSKAGSTAPPKAGSPSSQKAGSTALSDGSR
ncbi:delta-like protein C isoform X2 [Mytilus californianus]|uniref:delta-like protein C isoform X2 n=1 Tax=Mytilus californianus TaxID=6549 RepID=UPI00224524F1|nr:delta-like protein C isoform X2 [Mytilus californianus]